MKLATTGSAVVLAVASTGCRGGVNATLTISGVTATDEIEIVVTLAGNNARVDSEQRRQGPPSGTPSNQNPNRVSVNGRIESVDAAARTFVVDGTPVSVPLTATIGMARAICSSPI